MSIENVTTAFQINASTGTGLTLTLREARFVTFKIQGVGPVTAGQVVLECCPQATPMTQTPLPSGSGATWTVLNTIAVPANSTVEYRAGSVSGTDNDGVPSVQPGSPTRTARQARHGHTAGTLTVMPGTKMQFQLVQAVTL
jgi:hypothetical protein